MQKKKKKKSVATIFICVPVGPNCGKCWYQVMHTIYKIVLLTMKTWQFWTITALYYGTLVTKALKWSMFLNKKSLLTITALPFSGQSCWLKLKSTRSTVSNRKRYQTNCWINRSTKFETSWLIQYSLIQTLVCCFLYYCSNVDRVMFLMM